MSTWFDTTKDEVRIRCPESRLQIVHKLPLISFWSDRVCAPSGLYLPGFDVYAISMLPLRALAEKVNVDDYIAWTGEKAPDRTQVDPRRVRNIDHGETIRIDAEGSGGGTYFFTVDDSGDSEAFYVKPTAETPRSMGSVVIAELTDSPDPVTVKEGYYDRHSGSNRTHPYVWRVPGGSLGGGQGRAHP